MNLICIDMVSNKICIDITSAYVCIYMISKLYKYSVVVLTLTFNFSTCHEFLTLIFNII